jgi:hypothetical protein
MLTNPRAIKLQPNIQPLFRHFLLVFFNKKFIFTTFLTLLAQCVRCLIFHIDKLKEQASYSNHMIELHQRERHEHLQPNLQ